MGEWGKYLVAIAWGALLWASFDAQAGEEVKEFARNCANGQSTDAVLMARVQQGDQEAVATLYSRYEQFAFTTAEKIVSPKHRSVAEDIAQEALILLLVQKVPKDVANFKALLATTIRNKYLDYVRSPKSRDKVSLSGDDESGNRLDPAASDEQPGADLEKAELLIQLGRFIDRLPETEQTVIRLRHGSADSPTFEEIAESLAIPEGTAKTRYRQGMIKLRQWADEAMGEKEESSPKPIAPGVPLQVLVDARADKVTQAQTLAPDSADVLRALLADWDRSLLLRGPQTDGTGMSFAAMRTYYSRPIEFLEDRHGKAKAQIDALVQPNPKRNETLNRALAALTPAEREALRLAGIDEPLDRIAAAIERRGLGKLSIRETSQLVTDAKRLLALKLREAGLTPPGGQEKTELPEFLEEQIKTEDGKLKLLAAIELLPENQRRAVRLTVLNRFSGAQLAARLSQDVGDAGITVNAAQLRVHNGVKSLVDMYAKGGPEIAATPVPTKLDFKAAAGAPATRELMVARIEKLPPAIAAVMRLKLDGLSHAEVAERLNKTRTKPIDAGTVSRYYLKGVDALEALARLEETKVAPVKVKASEAFDLEREASTVDGRARLDAAVKTLDEKSRRVLELKLEGKSFSKILEIINAENETKVTRSAISLRYYAALEKLAKYYATRPASP